MQYEIRVTKLTDWRGTGGRDWQVQVDLYCKTGEFEAEIE